MTRKDHELIAAATLLMEAGIRLVMTPQVAKKFEHNRPLVDRCDIRNDPFLDIVDKLAKKKP